MVSAEKSRNKIKDTYSDPFKLKSLQWLKGYRSKNLPENLAKNSSKRFKNSSKNQRYNADT